MEAVHSATGRPKAAGPFSPGVGLARAVVLYRIFGPHGMGNPINPHLLGRPAGRTNMLNRTATFYDIQSATASRT